MNRLTPEAIIPLILITPIFGAISVLIVRNLKKSLIRQFAMFWSIVDLGLVLYLAWTYDWTAGGKFVTIRAFEWIPQFGLSFSFGYDAISLLMLILTSLMMPLITIGSWTGVTKRVAEFHVWLLLLEAAMLGVFVSTDFILFYACFEFTLIPMYFLIGIWGSGERFKAARVFFLYTFTGSMLTFGGLLYVAWYHATQYGEWTFAIADLIDTASTMSYHQQLGLMIAFCCGFAVKVPLFPVHTWLPLAHTEAPMAGSVDLAAVLLKLGTYGLLRFALPMCPLVLGDAAPVLATLAIIGILWGALLCWVQTDIKRLIAYSSVSHMGFCVLGMFALNQAGLTGSITYMLNHGLSTGALFLCVGMLYERVHTRRLEDMGGLFKVMPIWGSFLIFFTLSSVGLPGLNGFVSEFLCLLGAFTSEDVLGPGYAAVAGVGMIFAAIYLLYMVGRVVFGPLKLPDLEDTHERHGHASAPAAKIEDLNAREIITLIPLVAGCVWMGLFPGVVIESLATPIAQVLAPYHEALAQQAAGAATIVGVTP